MQPCCCANTIHTNTKPKLSTHSYTHGHTTTRIHANDHMSYNDDNRTDTDKNVDPDTDAGKTSMNAKTHGKPISIQVMVHKVILTTHANTERQTPH